ncbi:MAG: thiol oxidoreductase, partial [Deltaproteobacteria bacterium]|nr:thiol oxidoreductase [Deltaproteobacteria bacterium]
MTRWWVIALGLALGACGDYAELDELDELRQGGDATVDDRTTLAFSHSIPGLTELEQEQHRFGRGPFAFRWAPPQLGPLFNHDACVACHAGNGRGLSEIGPSVFGSQSLIRVSLETGTPEVPGGAVPVPGYGTQLQDHAVGELPEVRIALTWIERGEQYGDGELVMLREPRIAVTTPTGESLPGAIDMSYRQAPVVFGLGLLEAISEDTLAALADPDDADGDGVSGRVNVVWDVTTQSARTGRFGHKANVVTLREQ